MTELIKLEKTFEALLWVSVIMMFVSGLVLWAFPKDWIVTVKKSGDTYRGTLPPYSILNQFGKKLYVVFHLSGISMVLFLLILAIVE